MTFELDEKNGIINDKVTGERCVIFCKSRMQEMFSRLFETFGTGALVIWREMSKSTGKRLVNGTSENITADTDLFLETYVQRFMEAGIGRIEVVEFKPEEGEAKFRIYDNFFAELHHQEWTACDYVKGLVAGIYEQMVLETPKIVETKCIGKGDPYCEWQITSSQ